MDPNQSSRSKAVFWAPEIDAGMALFAIHPNTADGMVIGGSELQPSETRMASDGIYMAFGAGPLRIHALVMDQITTAALPAALVPFDADVIERLRATDRLWHTVNGRRAPDRRLTPQRRKRIGQMLRAVDGRTSNASYRQIAEAVFGADRVQSELWHESSLRYATLRLVRDGSALIAGGYRDLLRRRPSR